MYIKTKYLLYSFKQKINQRYKYWYESDNKYFNEKKPPQSILQKINDKKDLIDESDITSNPWLNWNDKNIQTITTNQGVCINYLKSTNQDLIQREEDLKLLELYAYLVENLDISKSFNFNTIKKWHKAIFETIFFD